LVFLRKKYTFGVVALIPQPGQEDFTQPKLKDEAAADLQK
jgi:hypothetical protein